ncbi:MAG: glycosyltransferase, partial [Acidobacteriota bacterium]
GRYRPEQLTRILGPIDVVVAPSVCEETGGLVVLEALAARLPVVGSRIGGIPEFIRDGETGFLFSPGDPAELASVLHRFIADPGLLLRMQSAIARPRGFERHVDDLLRSYRNVLQRKG